MKRRETKTQNRLQPVGGARPEEQLCLVRVGGGKGEKSWRQRWKGSRDGRGRGQEQEGRGRLPVA